mmetsp:Transcript_84812/g.137551  ORF Transcript_84812/g.137551 Transcript_84812/m.137551 type:complete len:242 (+) Transcript_84812:92-817(+)
MPRSASWVLPQGGKQCHAICDFFGSFGFFVQFILALFSFSALIIKRYQEKPPRNIQVFKFDVFKNGFGAGVVHFMNIFIAMQFAGKEDPCPWYFIQILLDTTLVVFLNFIVLRQVEDFILSRYGVDVSSGNYGDPPEWKRFFHQLGVWVFVVVACKLGTTVVEYVFEEPLASFGLLILSPLCFNPHLELFIVVVLLPLILNAFQFWMVDSYLMAQEDRGKNSNGLSANFFGAQYGSTDYSD